MTSDQDYAEVVGLFHSPEELEEAISTLTSSGWNRAELSLLAQHKALFSEDVKQQTEELADDETAERQAPISENDVRQGRTLAASITGVVAAFIASGATIMTGGATLAAVVGAAVAGGGAGGLVEMIGRRAGAQRAHFLEEEIEQGGILLWAKTSSPEQERKARDLFERCGATNVHVHGYADAESRQGQASG